MMIFFAKKNILKVYGTNETSKNSFEDLINLLLIQKVNLNAQSSEYMSGLDLPLQDITTLRHEWTLKICSRGYYLLIAHIFSLISDLWSMGN